MLDVVVGSFETIVSRPGSVKRAWPLLSIRMFALFDQDIRLVDQDISLVVHIDQPLSDAPELW